MFNSIEKSWIILIFSLILFAKSHYGAVVRIYVIWMNNRGMYTYGMYRKKIYSTFYFAAIVEVIATIAYMVIGFISADEVGGLTARIVLVIVFGLIMWITRVFGKDKASTANIEE